MSDRIELRGGRVIDPASGLDADRDLFIAGGRVVGIGRRPDGFEADEVVDADGLHVIPGLVDLRARLREPGQEHKGTIRSESFAAAVGGITTLCLPPDTEPAADSSAVVEMVRRCAAEASGAKVVCVGALTSGLAGRQLSEMAELRQAGCVAVSNADAPVHSARVMRHAMEYAANEDLLVVIQPNDAELAGEGCAHEGPVALRLGLTGIPEAAETAALARDLELVAQTGARAHFTCLSTRRAVDMIARAREDGLPVTADCAAQHLFLSDRDVDGFNSLCHLRPPLRDPRDRDGLRLALSAGQLQAVCSDHQPHDIDAKLAPFPSTEAGMSAVETLLPLMLRLAEEQGLPLVEVLAAVTCGPADILGLDAGRIALDAPADLCVYDPGAHWVLAPEDLRSHGHNTPLAGWDFRGKVTLTLVEGRKGYDPAALPPRTD